MFNSPREARSYLQKLENENKFLLEKIDKLQETVAYLSAEKDRLEKEVYKYV